MANDPLSIDPKRALTHPAWWLSLALLVLNDHVLKRAGVLPSWLTGTLSDVVGMVVAPIVAATLLGVRTRRGLALSFALVALPFVAIKTSHAASDLYVAALAAVGLHARNVVDPSDLVGLVAMALAWHLACAPGAERPRVALRRVGLMLASFGCVATSKQGPEPPVIPWATTGWIANRTNAQVELRLRWIGPALDCSAGLATLAEGLTREAFSGQSVTVNLEINQVLPLDRGQALAALMTFGSSRAPATRVGTGTCDAVLVQSDNFPSTVLLWNANGLVTVNDGRPAGGVEPEKGAVLTGTNGRLALSVTSGPMTARPLGDPPAPCADTFERFEVVADPAVWTAGITVTELTRLPDGCTRYGGMNSSVPVRLIVCAPADSLPVRMGDAVRVERLQNGATLTTPRNETVTIYRGASAREIEPHVALTPERTCRGLDACGAYVERYSARIVGVGDVLSPGVAVMRDGARIVFARAERTIISSERCGGPVTSAVTYDIVITRGVSP